MEVIGRAVVSGSESDRQITAALMTLPRNGDESSTRRRRGVIARGDRRDDEYPLSELWSRGFIGAVDACGPPSSRSPFNAVLRSTTRVTTRCA